MQLNEFDLKAFLAAYNEDSDVFEEEVFEHVEEGEWVQDCKYQYCTDVYLHIPSGRYVALHQSRSGSYHTDWYYNDPDLSEVFKVTETITRITYTAEKPNDSH